MLKLFYVYTEGKLFNKCWIKYCQSENEAIKFYQSLGYKVTSCYQVIRQTEPN